ncbi:hypothetical protein EZV73_08145 [Acidaminobacter sp. JC074]|uniref:hypothetical protein n=1 Tax=Acidaminobacter sp. JC074 TaxID=2530199 RepID=UPI00216F2DA0|nr:hypothetical protein [Acidaminobacter sp. JC074]
MNKESFDSPLKALIMIFTYIILIKSIGFYISTVAFFMLFACRYNGRTLKTIFMSIVIIGIVIYLLLIRDLGNTLLTGLLF